MKMLRLAIAAVFSSILSFGAMAEVITKSGEASPPSGSIVPGTTGFACATAGSIAYSDGTKIQCSVDSPFVPADSSSFNSQSRTLEGWNLSAAGTGSAGSANQFGLNIQVQVPATGATADYTKDAFFSLCRTADPGTVHAFYCVGADTRAYIANTNAAGWATAGLDLVQIESGGTGDGTLVARELDVINNGTDVTSPTTSKSKGGLLVAFSGSAPSTYGLVFTQYALNPQTAHSLIYADPAVIAASGFFAQMPSTFAVTKAGDIGAGSSAPQSNAGYGGGTLNGSSGGILSFTRANVEQSRIQGDNTQLLIDALINVPIVFKTNNTEYARLTAGTPGVLQLGTASTTTTQLALANASSAFLTTIQAGNAAAARTWTWPTNFGSAGCVLTDAAANGALSCAAASGGTVTSVSVTTANGVSGTVATATTTPAISLTLGAITPTSVATGDGTASNPAYTFGSISNLGMYTSGGNIRFGYNGSLLFQITQAGSIQLGASATPTLSSGGSAILQLGSATGAGAGVAQTLQGQGSTGATMANVALTIAGPDTSFAGTATGGDLDLRGGNATGASGTRTGGNVYIDGGTGASAGGQVIIRTAATTSLAAALTIGNDRSVTFTGALGSGVLIGDGTNVIAQRNGATTQEFRVYQTFTNLSDYSNGTLGFQTLSNVFAIATNANGTGTARGIGMAPGGTEVFRFTASGGMIAPTDNTYDIGASGAFRPRNIYVAGNGTFGGTLTATLTNVATTSAVCFNTGTGLLTYDGTLGTCTVSALWTKNVISLVEDNALSRMTYLRAGVWEYKDELKSQYDGRVHVGLYADDVEKMDKRCVAYKDGRIQNYDDRCVLAYLVAATRELNAKIEARL